MAGSTTNYGLSIMGDNEYVDQNVINENMQKIDEAIFEAGNNEVLEGNVAEIVNVVNTIDTKIGTSSKSVFDSIASVLTAVQVVNTSVGKGFIKNIQKGTFFISGSDSNKEITLSGFTNSNKMIAYVDGGATQTGSSNVARFAVPYVYNLTTSALTIKPNASINESMSGSYFVVEFN